MCLSDSQDIAYTLEIDSINTEQAILQLPVHNYTFRIRHDQWNTFIMKITISTQWRHQIELAHPMYQLRGAWGKLKKGTVVVITHTAIPLPVRDEQSLGFKSFIIYSLSQERERCGVLDELQISAGWGEGLYSSFTPPPHWIEMEERSNHHLLLQSSRGGPCSTVQFNPTTKAKAKAAPPKVLLEPMSFMLRKPREQLQSDETPSHRRLPSGRHVTQLNCVPGTWRPRLKIAPP